MATPLSGLGWAPLWGGGGAAITPKRLWAAAVVALRGVVLAFGQDACHSSGASSRCGVRKVPLGGTVRTSTRPTPSWGSVISDVRGAASRVSWPGGKEGG